MEEIAYAIIYCSTNQMCNPNASMSSLNLSNVDHEDEDKKTHPSCSMATHPYDAFDDDDQNTVPYNQSDEDQNTVPYNSALDNEYEDRKIIYGEDQNIEHNNQCTMPIRSQVQVKEEAQNLPSLNSSQNPSQNPSHVRDTNAIREITPVREITPIHKVTPIHEVTSARNRTPVRELSPTAEELSPIQGTLSPMREMTPLGELSPIPATSPMCDASPLRSVSPDRGIFDYNESIDNNRDTSDGEGFQGTASMMMDKLDTMLHGMFTSFSPKPPPKKASDTSRPNENDPEVQPTSSNTPADVPPADNTTSDFNYEVDSPIEAASNFHPEAESPIESISDVRPEANSPIEPISDFHPGADSPVFINSSPVLDTPATFLPPPRTRAHVSSRESEPTSSTAFSRNKRVLSNENSQRSQKRKKIVTREEEELEEMKEEPTTLTEENMGSPREETADFPSTNSGLTNSYTTTSQREKHIGTYSTVVYAPLVIHPRPPPSTTAVSRSSRNSSGVNHKRFKKVKKHIQKSSVIGINKSTLGKTIQI